jgi:hypothetical protein
MFPGRNRPVQGSIVRPPGPGQLGAGDDPRLLIQTAAIGKNTKNMWIEEAATGVSPLPAPGPRRVSSGGIAALAGGTGGCCTSAHVRARLLWYLDRPGRQPSSWASLLQSPLIQVTV